MTTIETSNLVHNLKLHNTAVQKPDDAPLLTDEPVTSVVPYVWHWSDLEPLLAQDTREAFALDTGGGRRTLRLVNPGLPYGTTHTLWTAIQQVLPGEVATCHRHTTTAFRFMFQGESIATTVDGERYPMEPGDVLLTPNWCWHDHSNTGSDLGLWLDGLDIPLVRSLNAMFYENYKNPMQDVSDPPDGATRQFVAPGMMPPKAAAPFLPVYKWQASLDALHALAAVQPDPYDDVILEYRNPVTAGPALKTIGLEMQLLRPGVHTLSHRHCNSTVYHVVRGEGATIIDGVTYDWREKDFIVIPPWAWHEHHNASGRDEAILFQMNDKPTMKALDLYRESGEG